VRLATRPAIPRPGCRSSLDLYADLVRTLGPDHPLVRTQRAITIATGHALNASVLVVGAACLGPVSRSLAIATAASAGLVTSILCGAVAVLSARRRQRVHDLILEGTPPALGLIRAEVKRLLEPANRARVAHALDRALREGEHWHEYLPASRPPDGVRHLPPNGPLIREIATDLCGERVSARAVILLDRLIQGGYGAAIYQGGPDWVKRELGRIHFELRWDAMPPNDPETR
jgi:hypothetical protein